MFLNVDDYQGFLQSHFVSLICEIIFLYFMMKYIYLYRSQAW
jgi:hypothetical protein